MESLNNLKHIPCPSGESCTVDKCLFQHQADRDRIAAETKKTPPPPPPSLLKQGTRRKQDDAEETDSLNGVTQRPQKRLKGEEKLTKSSLKPQQQIADPIEKRIAKSVRGDQTPTSKMAVMNFRGLSPPDHFPDAVNRRASFGNKEFALSEPSTPLRNPPMVGPNTAIRSEPRSTSAVKRNISSGNASTTPTPSKPKKVEALNPRMVHPPPAAHNTRHKILVQLHQQLKRLNDELKRDANDEEERLVFSQQELIWRSLDEEEKCAREKGTAGYKSAMGSRIMHLKKQSVVQWKVDREKEVKGTQKRDPRQAMLGKPIEITTGLTPAQEVKLLARLLTPIDKLGQHGYVTSIPTEVEIQESRRAIQTCDGWEQCDRCTKRFQVFPGRREEDGALTSTTTCVHHPGKTYYPPTKRSNDSVQQPKRYRCCNESVGDSVGCMQSDHHVFKVKDVKRLASVFNFAKTPETARTKLDRAVCFDCEMAYTVHGLEVIRVTATSWPTGEELLDVLVKPKGEILDLNSRYSGVWPEDFAMAEVWTNTEQPPPATQGADEPLSSGTTQPKRKLKIVECPEAARALLFSLLAPDTPLIGHGLENDLNGLRMIHPAIIDTVLLYPHHRGLPYRYGLKMLTEQYLNKVIQIEDSGENSPQGHDSAEDARAAGELVRFKVRDLWWKMQREGWTVTAGDLVAPVSTTAVMTKV